MGKVVIMSGVSGSGKSTYAARLKETAEGTVVIVSADTYFVGRDGAYNFDGAKLSTAHGECFRAFVCTLGRGCELVIVDNTNTTAEEVSPYILAAQAWGYEAEIITILCETEADVEAAAARSTHGVTLATALRQHENLRQRRHKPWWKNTFIRAQFD